MKLIYGTFMSSLFPLPLVSVSNGLPLEQEICSNKTSIWSDLFYFEYLLAWNDVKEIYNKSLTYYWFLGPNWKDPSSIYEWLQQQFTLDRKRKRMRVCLSSFVTSLIMCFLVPLIKIKLTFSARWKLWQKL